MSDWNQRMNDKRAFKRVLTRYKRALYEDWLGTHSKILKAEEKIMKKPDYDNAKKKVDLNGKLEDVETRIAMIERMLGTEGLDNLLDHIIGLEREIEELENTVESQEREHP